MKEETCLSTPTVSTTPAPSPLPIASGGATPFPIASGGATPVPIRQRRLRLYPGCPSPKPHDAKAAAPLLRGNDAPAALRPHQRRGRDQTPAHRRRCSTPPSTVLTNTCDPHVTRETDRCSPPASTSLSTHPSPDLHRSLHWRRIPVAAKVGRSLACPSPQSGSCLRLHPSLQWRLITV